jgi:hypothetical protein
VTTGRADKTIRLTLGGMELRPLVKGAALAGNFGGRHPLVNSAGQPRFKENPDCRTIDEFGWLVAPPVGSPDTISLSRPRARAVSAQRTNEAARRGGGWKKSPVRAGSVLSSDAEARKSACHAYPWLARCR